MAGNLQILARNLCPLMRMSKFWHDKMGPGKEILILTLYQRFALPVASTVQVTAATTNCRNGDQLFSGRCQFFRQGSSLTDWPTAEPGAVSKKIGPRNIWHRNLKWTAVTPEFGFGGSWPPTQKVAPCNSITLRVTQPIKKLLATTTDF